MRHAHFITSVALVAAAVLSGCRSDKQAAQSGTDQPTHHEAGLMVPSGTSIEVALATPLSSKTASVGSTWTGTTRNAVVLDGHNVIPAGSSVTGTVTGVTPARKGDRAMLDLGLTSIMVGDHSYRVHGGMESIVAGSTRARNLGAIGAATAAGALIGAAVGGSTKGAVVGGVVGGGAATAAVAKSSGYQVELKEGTPLTFTTSEALAVRQ